VYFGVKGNVFYGKTKQEFLFAFNISVIWGVKSQFHGNLRIGRAGENKIMNIFVLKLYMLDKIFHLIFVLQGTARKFCLK
jgi:hypothetical protein